MGKHAFLWILSRWIKKWSQIQNQIKIPLHNLQKILSRIIHFPGQAVTNFKLKLKFVPEIPHT